MCIEPLRAHPLSLACLVVVVVVIVVVVCCCVVVVRLTGAVAVAVARACHDGRLLFIALFLFVWYEQLISCAVVYMLCGAPLSLWPSLQAVDDKRRITGAADWSGRSHTR